MLRMYAALCTTAIWLCAADATAQEADLSVAASAVYEFDGTVTVTATVKNDGPDDVLDMDLTAQFDTATATATELETGCSGSSIGAVCAFSSLDTPALAAGDELVVVFVLVPEESAGPIELSVRSSVADPDESNNSDSVALVAATEVNVGVDERAIDAGRRKTLVFIAHNEGPDIAGRVSIAGSVTVNFDAAVDRDSATALTGMEFVEGAVCGRQVPDSVGEFDRWSFPVSCSIADLAAGDEVEFRFWFDNASNAQFRLTATSDGVDVDPANNVTDGSFNSSPIEVIADESDESGCATAGAYRGLPGPTLFVLLCIAVRRGTRRRGQACVRSGA